LIISDYSENVFHFGVGTGFPFKSNDGGRYYLSSVGIISVKLDPSGVGIIAESISKTIPSILLNTTTTVFLRGNFVYWIDGAGIRRMDLRSVAAEETIYSNTNLVRNNIFLVGDQVIFHQYFNATTVGTYVLSLSDLSAPPRLMSESTVEIRNIIELRF